MKILILGNSNSILSDGWVRSMMRAMPNAEFINFSIGGSPSPALLYQFLSKKHILNSINLVIVEPTVVDHGESWMNANNIMSQAMVLFNVLLSHNLNILLLILPRNEGFAVSPSKGMTAWAYAAKCLKIPFVDARKIIIGFANSSGCDLKSLWRDHAGHLTADVQALIANHVIEWIEKSVINEAQFVDTVISDYISYNGEYLSEYNNILPVTRSTSLLTVNCLSLYSGQNFKIPVKKNQALLGLAINYGEVNPAEPLLIKTDPNFHAVSYNINLQNKFLTAQISRKLVVMFVKVSSHLGVGEFIMPDIDSHKRMCFESDQRLEVAGALVGVPILDCNSWQNEGSKVLFDE